MPCKVKIGISTSGSGQMQPLPMNELVKEQMDEAGFEVELVPMDWNALINVFFQGAEKPRASTASTSRWRRSTPARASSRSG